MGASASEVFGGYLNSIAVSFLKDFLKAKGVPTKFLRADFIWWLRGTPAADSYGEENILKGLDGLVKVGHVVKDGDHLVTTPAFIKILQERGLL